jgi:hypothetical protein
MGDQLSSYNGMGKGMIYKEMSAFVKASATKQHLLAG